MESGQIGFYVIRESGYCCCGFQRKLWFEVFFAIDRVESCLARAKSRISKFLENSSFKCKIKPNVDLHKISQISRKLYWHDSQFREHVHKLIRKFDLIPSLFHLCYRFIDPAKMKATFMNNIENIQWMLGVLKVHRSGIIRFRQNCIIISLFTVANTSYKKMEHTIKKNYARTNKHLYFQWSFGSMSQRMNPTKDINIEEIRQMTYLSKKCWNGSLLKWLNISSIYGCTMDARCKVK